MYVLPPPLLAMHGEEVFAILAFFGPFWLAVISISLVVTGLRHRRKSRETELGAEMIRDMLARKMTADEIERVLCAWGGRRAQLKKLVKAREQAYAPSGKPVSALA